MGKIKGYYIYSFLDKSVDFYSYDGEGEIHKGDFVIFTTKYGEDIGLAKSELEEKEEGILEKSNYTAMKNGYKVIRKATEEEIKKMEGYRKEEEKLLEEAEQLIKKYNLPMKLLAVHIVYNYSRIIYTFSSEQRVDFRNLVKELAGRHHTRIEMRQVGARDAVRFLGNIGFCGLEACCTRTNCYRMSITLKMAKEQNLGINVAKITGPCGRLLCCLAYELDYYLNIKQKLPAIGEKIFMENKNREGLVKWYNYIKEVIYVEDLVAKKIYRYSFDEIKATDGKYSVIGEGKEVMIDIYAFLEDSGE